MTLSLGKKLSIRSLVYVAGKPIPFFWPMRSFIHHNPLHGLENLPFDEAVIKARKLFHARTYLYRKQYQRYLAEGKLELLLLELQRGQVALVAGEHVAAPLEFGSS